MSAVLKNGGPAFAGRVAGPEYGPQAGAPMNDGMTLRDYFAASALSGVVERCALDTKEPGESIEQYFARRCYNLADAMLAERAK